MNKLKKRKRTFLNGKWTLCQITSYRNNSFLTNLILPYKSTVFDTCPVGGVKERLRSSYVYNLFVSKDIKTSIRNYKHGTFPFYSSFIKVETDLMCMRRNFSFCVLSPNEVSKTEKKKKKFYRFTSCPFFCTCVATEKSAVG